MNFAACKPRVHILSVHYMSNKYNCSAEAHSECKRRKVVATLWNW